MAIKTFEISVYFILSLVCVCMFCSSFVWILNKFCGVCMWVCVFVCMWLLFVQFENKILRGFNFKNAISNFEGQFVFDCCCWKMIWNLLGGKNIVIFYSTIRCVCVCEAKKGIFFLVVVYNYNSKYVDKYLLFDHKLWIIIFFFFDYNYDYFFIIGYLVRSICNQFNRLYSLHSRKITETKEFVCFYGWWGGGGRTE